MKRSACIYPALCLFFVFLLGGCSGKTGAETSPTPAAPRMTVTKVRLPLADGQVTYGSETVLVDASHTADGYFYVKYQGQAEAARLQLTAPDGTVYAYQLESGRDGFFPLSGGSGAYLLEVLEHAYDNLYALSFSQELSVELADEFTPFLYPNHYAWYTEESKATALARELSEQSTDDVSYVGQVYDYVTRTISYDTQKAEAVPVNYIPDIDATLAAGKGICFDYAALMTAMLRSQSIPTRLEVGYSGTVYHAWISVYLAEIGWVDDMIQFDGQSWSLMDPTLAAGNSRREVKKYMGDGSNYTMKFCY